MEGGPETSLRSHQTLPSATGSRHDPPTFGGGPPTLPSSFGLFTPQHLPFPNAASGTGFTTQEPRFPMPHESRSRVQSVSAASQSNLPMFDSGTTASQHVATPMSYWQSANPYSFNSGRNSASLQQLASSTIPTTTYDATPPVNTGAYQSPTPRSSAAASPTMVSPPQQRQHHHPSISHVLMSSVPEHDSLPALSQQHAHVEPYMRRISSSLYQQHSTPPQPQPSPVLFDSQASQYTATAPPPHVPSPTIVPPTQPTVTLGGLSRPYPSYTLPAMHGPVMTNIASPSGNFGLLGGFGPTVPPNFNSGMSANLSHMYNARHTGLPGHVSPGAPPHTQLTGLVQAVPHDRPFKCDLCPQSFNRNHDLKRHKRIHLAVKPFPCKYCDKSFSRKDALKRHTLVKGCGKAAAAAAAAEKSGENTSSETNAKTESNEGDNSETTFKKNGDESGQAEMTQSNT